MTWEKLLPLLWNSTVETLYMTFWSSMIAYAVGLPLGVLLVITRKDGNGCIGCSGYRYTFRPN